MREVKAFDKPKAGGGFHALQYTLASARRVGFWQLWKAMTSRNACKTCAVGMGGQAGGMRNERGHFPEVCKKSLQAMTADMQGALAPSFCERYSVKELQMMSPRELETAGRLVRPLLLGAGASHYREITWEAAYELVAKKMRATKPAESFFYFSGRSSNEAGFLLQLFARLYGTNHVNNCSFYCHQASGVGLGNALGTGTATVQLEDVGAADCFFLFGGNPASNHPRLMTELMHMRRRGGKVIVVNPVVETGLVEFRIPSDVRSLLFGTKIASHYAKIHIGGDIAFCMGIAKALLAHGQVDQKFVAQATLGWDAAQAALEQTSWEAIEASCGMSRAAIEALAAVYAGSKRAIFAWTMGITHHVHGVANVHWIVNLALLRGMVGRPGAGLLPIRGHSNVQGLGTVGVTPALKEAVFKRFQENGIALPTHQGHDTMGCMQAAVDGKMRVAWALGGNLYGSNPDANFASHALLHLDLMIYLNTSLNTGHAHGLGKETLILPVLARDEEPYKTTQESMFSYMRLSDGGKARHAHVAGGGPRGEVEIVAEIAHRVLGSGGVVDWAKMRDTDEIRAWIARLFPGLEALQRIGKTKQEFAVPGRALHEAKFPTKTGKAQFHADPLPLHERAAEPGSLRLMTVRSEGQFNTVVYEDHDYYRGQERRDVILISADDMQRLGLETDDRVTVRSAAGSMRGILVRPFDVLSGNVVMYYPEANVLVPRQLDPASGTPTFKNVAVTLERESAAPVAAGGGGGGRSLVADLRQMLRRRFRPALKPCGS